MTTEANAGQQRMAVAAPPAMSPRAAGWWSLPGHALLAGAALFVAGFVFTLLGSPYDGILSWLGYVIWPAVMTVVSVPIVVALGLPLRIARPLRRWWMTHGGWLDALATVGLGVLVLSYFVDLAGPIHQPAGYGQPAFTVYAPDWRLFVVGWFFMGFGLAHAWWPFSWRTSAGRSRILARH
jgi:hypothetical protein